MGASISAKELEQSANPSAAEVGLLVADLVKESEPPFQVFNLSF